MEKQHLEYISKAITVFMFEFVKQRSVKKDEGYIIEMKASNTLDALQIGQFLTIAGLALNFEREFNLNIFSLSGTADNNAELFLTLCKELKNQYDSFVSTNLDDPQA